MHTSFARRLVLGALVCATVATAPTVASAATTYATIDNECWLREYPPDTTCDNGWVGTIGVGQTNLGESVSFFDADFNLPSGAEVTEATLRFDNPYTANDTVWYGEASNLDWFSSTWANYDLDDIDVVDGFVPGTYGLGKEYDITAAIQGYVANSQSGVTLGLYSDPGSDPTFLDNIEIEIEYDL